MNHVTSGLEAPRYLRCGTAFASTSRRAGICNAGAASASERPGVIGYSTHDVGNPALAGIAQGMKSKAKTFGYKVQLGSFDSGSSAMPSIV